MRRQKRSRAGHSLVEVIVACGLFMLAALAAQRALLAIARHDREARLHEQALQAVGDRIERSVNVPCTTSGSGVTRLRQGRVEWRVGPAIEDRVVSVQQTVIVPSPAAVRTDLYATAVRCR
jgi:type II secretory pathway component PulJ